MVQSNQYYKSRAVGVSSEVSLTTDRDFPVLIFDERPKSATQSRFFRWVQVQGRGLDTSGGSKNASGPVGIPLKVAPQAPGDKPNFSKEKVTSSEAQGNWPSATDARQSVENLLHEAEIFQYWPCLRNTSYFNPPRYRKSRGTSHYATVTQLGRRVKVSIFLFKYKVIH